MSSEITAKVVFKKDPRTIAVEVSTRRQHKRYPKIVKYSKRYSVHVSPSSEGEPRIGDTVLIKECRPISKTKHMVFVGFAKSKE